MKIQKATEKYEAWLADRVDLIQADLALKHQAMATGPFPFLRATFYRWVQLWPEVCPKLAKAPEVLAVGDLHLENFGTWRDKEGRLVWGINDFDEAHWMPYTIDLVRLAASAYLATHGDHLAIGEDDACEAILGGYAEGLEAGGKAFVLAERNHWLREITASELRDPVHFWRKMDELPGTTESIPSSAVKAITRLLPESGLPFRVVRRVAGLGSLGRPRFVALADWHGGRIAREAKALVASAFLWTSRNKGSSEILYQQLLDNAVRCRDPFFEVRGRWIARRLAPDCSRVELASLPKERDEKQLLHAMGWETANVHLAKKKAVKAVRADLDKRPRNWLRSAAKKMAEATIHDWEDWKNDRAHLAPKAKNRP